MKMDILINKFLDSRDEQSCFNLVNYLRCKHLFHIGKYLSKFIRNMFPYSISINDELGIIHYYIEDYQTSYEIFKDILSLPSIPEHRSKLLIFNQHFNINHIKYTYSSYNPKIINKILNRKQLVLTKKITFSITTCKRYDLFSKTINSFINCCKDIDMIDEWLCIDDNSSEEDREKMKQNYPFFTFYFKNASEKGHPRSMNIIKNKVNTPFLFHMEDDWLFFEKRKYITDCLHVLECSRSEIKQCLINKNYAEIPEDHNIAGGLFNVTSSGIRYYIHEHTRNKNDEENFYNKYGPEKNCAYWPHFSFRPSLIKTSVFSEIGDFNESVGHFEMEYSYRYVQKNYESAFLESIYCIHTGRLTSERHDESKLDAYLLNNETQFGPKVESKPFKTFVINLDRRPDRYEDFVSNFQIHNLKYERFSAVDGEKLNPNCQLQHIFENNDYNMRKGMVGCAMSNIKLYIQLLKDEDVDTYCILEDDLTFVDNFTDKLNLCIRNLEATDWDLLYLGHHLWKDYIDENSYNKSLDPIIKQYNRFESLKMSMGGTGGYLINKKGAEKLLEFINKHGMTNGIDTVQQKSADDLNVYYCYPHLIYSECFMGEENVDTDIQKDFSSLNLEFNDFVNKELSKYSEILQISLNDLPNILNSWDNTKPSSIVIDISNTINVREFLDQLDILYYILDYKILILSKNDNGRLFHRFKINGEWNINEALS